MCVCVCGVLLLEVLHVFVWWSAKYKGVCERDAATMAPIKRGSDVCVCV